MLSFGFWLVAFATCLVQTPARGAELAVIQSAYMKPYNQALHGIEEALARDIPSRGPKSVTAHTLQSYILSKNKNPSQLSREILQKQPDTLLVIGSSSLSLVKGIEKKPIIYLMVPFPGLMTAAQDNITGINMNIEPDREIDQLMQVAPQVKKIGLLYDPDRTEAFVQKARNHAIKKGLSLVALPVKHSSEVFNGLEKLKGKIDWFWMVPDLTVLTPQTIDFIMLFSLENRVPVLTFSDKYLDMGAVLSVSTDPRDMGRQAAELALQIMRGEEDPGRPPVQVRKIIVKTNHQAARILGIELHPPESGKQER